MKKIFWFVTGIAAGLAVAKQLAENPKAAALAEDATKRAKEFGAAVSEGFREREAELSKPVKAVKKPASKTTKKPATTRKPAAKKAPANKTK